MYRHSAQVGNRRLIDDWMNWRRTVENLDGCFADPGAASGDDDVFALQLWVKFFSVDCDRCHGF